MENLFGSIDLTKLGNIVRQHPEAVRKVQFKDGSTHQFFNINLAERKEVDQKTGNTHYLKAGIKKAEQKEGVNYFIGDLKPSTNNAAPVNTPASQQTGNDTDSLPF